MYFKEKNSLQTLNCSYACTIQTFENAKNKNKKQYKTLKEIYFSCYNLSLKYSNNRHKQLHGHTEGN